MIHNEQQRVQRADLVLANIQSNGGLLSPQQSDTFFEILMEQPTMISQVRTVQMTAPKMNIPKIGLGQRILRAAVENTRLRPQDRTRPDFGNVTLETSEVIAEVRIPYAALEDNVERGGMENTILRLIGKRAALDMEEWLILSDTSSADDFLALDDGVMKLTQSRVVDCSPTDGVKPASFTAALKALPPKYKRNKASLRFYTTYNAEEDWRLQVSNRQTVLGDVTLATGNAVSVQGVPIVPCSYMPEGFGVLSDPQNYIVGIQRDFRLESDRLIADRQIRIVLTARIALAIETEDASVKMTNLVTPT